jgi:CO/xanthine dehydrogenase FAD-binding subunit
VNQVLGAFSPATLRRRCCLAAEIEIASAVRKPGMPLSDFYTGEGDAYRNLRSDELLTQIFLPNRRPTTVRVPQAASSWID